LFLALLPFLLIGAAILKTACKWAGVTEPGFVAAIGINFLTALLYVMLVFAALFAFAAIAGVAGSAGMMSPAQMQRAAPFMAAAFFLLGPISAALVYKTVFLDCSFGRGLLVWFNQILVMAIIFGILGAIGYGLKSLQKGSSR
jgi:hypothetical protein